MRTARHRFRVYRPKRRTPPGAPPGTLVVDPQAQPPRIRVTAYGPNGCEERTLEAVAGLSDFLGRWPVVWVDVDGLGDLDVIRSLAATFRLHDLALEDVVNAHQRAKAEDYVHHLFLVMRGVSGVEAVTTEQVTLFLGDGYLLSFHDAGGWNLDHVRERLRRAVSPLRRAGADHLAYTILDTVIDGYFPLLERLGETLEQLEEEVIAEHDPQIIARIHQVKHDLLHLRRAVWPLREMLNALIRDPLPYLTEPTRVYLRDAYDHCVQLMDMIETYRELTSGLMELHLASVSNRLNEVMQVLTMISTIFIPLSVIVGVYGMNFDTAASPLNMPELGWRYGYPFALGLMAVTSIGMLLYFRRKGWFGRRRRTGAGS